MIIANETLLLAGVIVVSMAWALLRTGDVLHPLMYLMPMAGFMYVYLPLLLHQTDLLDAYFSARQQTLVQTVNLACVAALAAGCAAGTVAGPARLARLRAQRVDLLPGARARMRLLGLGFAAICLGTWVFNIGNVGGFTAAYSVSKGGGTATSGYLRDFFFLGIPAIPLLFLASRGEKPDRLVIAALVLVIATFLAHGLLSSRRGPTFNVVAAMVFGYYVVRGIRPSLPLAGGIAAAGGLLLLALVTFRADIHLGSDLLSRDLDAGTVTDSIRKKLVKTPYSNEFMYGASTILYVEGTGRVYHGRRYLATLLIRPIPRQIWPTKFEDVGLGALEHNAGVRTGSGTAPRQHTQGAAPGLAADLFTEFGWGAVGASLVLGWLFGWTWLRATTSGGLWIVVYTTLASISVHLVTQTGNKFVFMSALLLIPIVVGWHAVTRLGRRRDEGAMAHLPAGRR